MRENHAVLIDAIVIGRNEGTRLQVALGSLQGQVRRLIYVDSGSSDSSVELAKSMGSEVLRLDLRQPFTAARARNLGLASLASDPPEFVQFMDGDCQLDAGWIEAAMQVFRKDAAAVVVCGRRRERYPRASIYNRLIDREWDTPIGLAKACGGDAMMRYDAVRAVGGFRGDLIAGEEPELCLRLRRAGGKIWRIEAEMTLHDAALLHFSQWWRRSVRAGHAYAEGAYLHGAAPERHWRKETLRALGWGAVLPVMLLGAAAVQPWFLLGWLIYPLQVTRLARQDDVVWAVSAVVGKFAEALGVAQFYLRLLSGRKPTLIEYK